MVSICIIDDGVKAEMLESKLLFDFEVAKNSRMQLRNDNVLSAKSHGTECAQIITKYCSEVIISSIKLDKLVGRTSNKHHLLKALNYCFGKSFNVIHMSIGTTSYSDFVEIKEIVDKLTDSGKIIIAACNNKNIYTVPACLSNVIGVCTSRYLYDDKYEVNSHNCDSIDFIASSRHWINNRYTVLSNSYAAPLITAKVCEILSKNDNLKIDEVRKILIENSQNYRDNSILVRREELITNNPLDLDQHYHTMIESKPINNPTVCLYNISGEDQLHIKELFAQKGYNCLLITNRLQKDFFNIEYVNFSNKKIICKATEALNTFYNPDLLILGVFNQPELDINKYIETDIIYKRGCGAGLHNDVMYINQYSSIKALFNEIYEILGGSGD